MESIFVKTKNGVKCYMSGTVFEYNSETGKTDKKVIRTKEEELQSCYESLIQDIKTSEFNKNLISLLKTYYGNNMDNFKNIKILIDGDWHCEINIPNPENIFDFNLSNKE